MPSPQIDIGRKKTISKSSLFPPINEKNWPHKISPAISSVAPNAGAMARAAAGHLCQVPMAGANPMPAQVLQIGWKKPYLDLSSTILLRRGADAAPRRAGEQGSAEKTVMGKGIVSHDVVPIFEHKMENMPIVRRWRIRIWELLVRVFFSFF